MKALIFLGLVMLGQFASAGTVVPAMTCDQAIAYYEKHGRIYVSNGYDVLPIYGMKPISKWREVVCRGRNKSRQNYWVRTSDDSSCVIASFCG